MCLWVYLLVWLCDRSKVRPTGSLTFNIVSVGFSMELEGDLDVVGTGS